VRNDYTVTPPGKGQPPCAAAAAAAANCHRLDAHPPVKQLAPISTTFGGRLLSEADELCGGDADNMDSTTDSFMRFLKTLPFASYCDIKCTRDRSRQCAMGTHINVASPCLPRVCEINDYHCNCNQNSKCLMSQHVSRKNDRITRVRLSFVIAIKTPKLGACLSPHASIRNYCSSIVRLLPSVAYATAVICHQRLQNCFLQIKLICCLNDLRRREKTKNDSTNASQQTIGRRLNSNVNTRAVVYRER